MILIQSLWIWSDSKSDTLCFAYNPNLNLSENNTIFDYNSATNILILTFNFLIWNSDSVSNSTGLPYFWSCPSTGLSCFWSCPSTGLSYFWSCPSTGLSCFWSCPSTGLSYFWSWPSTSFSYCWSCPSTGLSCFWSYVLLLLWRSVL